MESSPRLRSALSRLKDIHEGLQSDKATLRFLDLRRFVKPNGRRACACGKTISANKRQCFECSQKKEDA